MPTENRRSLSLVGFFLWVSLCCPALGQQSTSPRLTLILIVDGLSQEHLLQHQEHYTRAGLGRLLEQGARLSNAHYTHAGTLTATGHATLLTGAHPDRHGMVGNHWVNDQNKELVYSVEDPEHQWLDEPGGGPHLGTSPANLRLGTLGDQLRTSSPDSRVVAISGKDRSAIIAAGKKGEAYFFSNQTGRFVTTTYYRSSYPDWWTRFHAPQPQNGWFGSQWTPLLEASRYDPAIPNRRSQHVDEAGLGKGFPHPINGGKDQIGPSYYHALIRTPLGDHYTLEFARAAIEGEQLGKRIANRSDLLLISLSSLDHVNHSFGPESHQAQDHLVRLDRSLARFFEFLDGWLEPSQTLVVLTSDHGFPNTPEDCQRRGQEAGRIDPQAMLGDLNAFLSDRFGDGQYALAWLNPTIYLDLALMKRRQLEPGRLESSAAEFLRTYPGIENVFTRTQVETGTLPATPLAARVRLSWDQQRSGHLFVVQKPCWYLLREPRALASTHGSPHPYDTHVPLIFLGDPFRAGGYAFPVQLVDVAPTLAQLLGLTLWDGASGRVLKEILVEPKLAY